MSNRRPKKKIKIKKIQQTPPPEDFIFPLPLMAGRQPEALPGFAPVNLPIEPGGIVKKSAWENNIRRAKKDLAPWLSKAWWDTDLKIVCQSSKFRQAVREALSVKIEIRDWESLFKKNPYQWGNIVASEWSIRLFGKYPPPDTWECRVGPGHGDGPGQCVFEPVNLDIKRICRIAEFMPAPSRSINGPLCEGEFGLAFPKGILAATRRSPQVRSKIADLLEELACRIRPERKPSSEIFKGKLHHGVAVSLIFSWWVKRGGSLKKFPHLAKFLLADLDPEWKRFKDELPTEAYARESRKRLTPDLLWTISIVGQDVWNKTNFLSRTVQMTSSSVQKIAIIK